MLGLIELAFRIQREQLVDSTVPETRYHWRRRILGLSEDIARDPRPLAEVLGVNAASTS